MSKVKIQGNASGTGVFTIEAPGTNDPRTITLPDSTGTLLDENSSLPAANLTGDIAGARLPDPLPIISGANLTNLPTSLVFLDGGPTGGGSTVDFTSGIDTTYDKYIFYIANARANSDSTNLCIQISTDGGSTWKSGATDYEYASHGYDSGGSNKTKTSTGDSKIYLSDLAKMGTAEGMYSGFVSFSEPNMSGKWSHFEWTVSYGHQTSQNICVATGTGAYRANTAINGVRFLWSAGSFSDGGIRLYGIKDA